MKDTHSLAILKPGFKMSLHSTVWHWNGSFEMKFPPAGRRGLPRPQASGAALQGGPCPPVFLQTPAALLNFFLQGSFPVNLKNEIHRPGQVSVRVGFIEELNRNRTPTGRRASTAGLPWTRVLVQGLCTTWVTVIGLNLC